jgi:hypothetical protein
MGTILFLTGICQSSAQTRIVADSLLSSLGVDSTFTLSADSTFTLSVDSTFTLTTDSLMKVVDKNLSLLRKDSSLVKAAKELKPSVDPSTWTPNPQRALWLALVIPGGGQIYNRKYWKLPLVYGGFLGCIYAMSWNNSMYKDYSQAYLDLSDEDPATQSYNQFLHLGMKITTDAQRERYKDIFKKRKDKYRRWRDLSFFVMIGVYALSVIDAYVDAELSVFDISKDLSLKVEPMIINNHSSGNLLDDSSVGLQCSLNF